LYIFYVLDIHFQTQKFSILDFIEVYMYRRHSCRLFDTTLPYYYCFLHKDPKVVSFVIIFASPMAKNIQHYKLYVKLANKNFQTL